MTDASSLAAVRRSFARWAPFYGPTHRLLPFRREAVERLALRPGHRALDLACGTGMNLSILRETVGPGGEVIGFDLSPEMLSVARNRVRRSGWQNVRIEEGDAAHLPFPEASFDGVVCTYALNIIPDHLGALRETHRVLRPGGRLAIADTELATARPMRMPLPCAVRPGRDLERDLRGAFHDVQVERRIGGRFLVAVARREA